MVIHYTKIYNNVVFPGKKACIFRFKGRKSCAHGDSVTLEFMFSDPYLHEYPVEMWSYAETFCPPWANNMRQPSRYRAGNPAFLLLSRIPAFLRERPAFLASFREKKSLTIAITSAVRKLLFEKALRKQQWLRHLAKLFLNQKYAYVKIRWKSQ